MTNCQNIILVGLMGAGKTTAGRHLARRLGRRFVDVDHEIEARTGVRIPVIFEIEGEAGFRRRESETLATLTQEHGLVLATGGGAVLAAENRRRLQAAGLVVYLHVLPLVLHERTRHDRNRPLLQVANPLAKLEALYTLRDPLYREVADVVIDTGSGNVNALMQQLETEIRQRCEP